MLDQLRRDIQVRLDQLLSEADKLRHALAALGSRDRAKAPTATGISSPTSARKSVRSAPATRAPTRKPARQRPSAKPTAVASSQPVQSQATAPSPAATGGPVRTAPGATKTAVLTALANGDAMTAGEVAAVTGLGRASVSTTLSKLAKTGEVTKAARGYQIAGQTTKQAAGPAAGSADDEQSVT